jgi:uncharacterized DUF497 family protein
MGDELDAHRPPPGALDESLLHSYTASANLIADPEMAEWVATKPVVEWDAGNRTKSQLKHGFSEVDVESIFREVVVLAGRIVKPAHDEPRHLLLGVTSDGRNAALVFTRRGEYLRPISCRAMRKDERELYDESA